MNMVYSLAIYFNAPQQRVIYIKNSVSPLIKGLIETHYEVMFSLGIILLGVALIIVSVFLNRMSYEPIVYNKTLKTTLYLIPALLIVYSSLNLLTDQAVCFYDVIYFLIVLYTILIAPLVLYSGTRITDKLKAEHDRKLKHSVKFVLDDPREIVYVNLVFQGYQSWDTNSALINGASAYKVLSTVQARRNFVLSNGALRREHSNNNYPNRIVRLNTVTMFNHNVILTFNGRPLLPMTGATQTPRGYTAYLLPNN